LVFSSPTERPERNLLIITEDIDRKLLRLFRCTRNDEAQYTGKGVEVVLIKVFPNFLHHKPSACQKKIMKEIINCAAYEGGRRIADVELIKVHEVLQHANQFVWIGLHEPSEEVLQRVQQEFNLHDLAIEDAHLAHQRPKIELRRYRFYSTPHCTNEPATSY
jgi:hypothetical protein